MSSPTAKEIRKAFPDLDDEAVKELVEVLERPDKVDAENKSHWDDAYLRAVDKAMEEANEILGGHGVEAVPGEGADNGKYWRDTIALYVNLGDTYDTTVMYDTETEEFFVGSWGDFLEEWEKDQEDDDEDEEEEEEEDEEEEAEEKGEEV